MRHVVIPLGEVKPSNENIEVGTTVSNTVTMADGLTIPNTPEGIAAYQEGQKAARRAAQAVEAERLALNTGRQCPFMFDENMGRGKDCKRDCVFYSGDSCVFSAQEATAGTTGKTCPFRLMRRCVEDCALYRDGCTMRRG